MTNSGTNALQFWREILHCEDLKHTVSGYLNLQAIWDVLKSLRIFTQQSNIIGVRHVEPLFRWQSLIQSSVKTKTALELSVHHWRWRRVTTALTRYREWRYNALTVYACFSGISLLNKQCRKAVIDDVKGHIKASCCCNSFWMVEVRSIYP